MVTTNDILAEIRTNPFSRDLIEKGLSQYGEEVITPYIVAGLERRRSEYELNLSFVEDALLRIEPQEMKRIQREFDAIPSLLDTLQKSGLIFKRNR